MNPESNTNQGAALKSLMVRISAATIREQKTTSFGTATDTSRTKTRDIVFHARVTRPLRTRCGTAGQRGKCSRTSQRVEGIGCFLSKELSK
jgi:hypothetical protein